MRWGRQAREFTAEAGPGDFIYVPPGTSRTGNQRERHRPLSCVLCRSGQEPVVVNLDMFPRLRNPEEVHWVDKHPPGAEEVT